MRHGGQQAVQLNVQLQGAGKMAEVNIGCVPKLSWINLTGRNLSARPFLNYFRAGLQTVFNGAASLSGVLKLTVLLNDSEIQTATVKRIAAGERELPAQIEHTIYVMR